VIVMRVAALALVLAACGSSEPLVREAPPAEITVPTQTPEPTATVRPKRAPRKPARRTRAPRPVRVRIAAIGVDTPLIPLGLDANRALEVPERFDVAGWWSGGYRPGEPGPAVIAGHVDSKTGPAVFYRLGKLERGDAVTVERRDGSAVRFTVRAVRHYAKRAFPTRQVYGPTPRPTLRLITCSGDFDRSTGHYIDNTVVYAEIP
jgi:sortase (surface protein transpeptidase)